jgi:GT2 family glycosyltransferase
MPPQISVIVLNYRSPRDTVKCVQALRKQTIANEIEIIVVDNHSDDESIGFIRAQLNGTPSVRIVEKSANLGFGKANNRGVDLARGEEILILNPDNILPPDALEKTLAILRSSPDIGIVAPALVYPDGTVRPSARPFPRIADILWKRANPESWQRRYDAMMAQCRQSDLVDVDWVVGAFILMRKDLFLSIGGFDERFFLFFEDIDLCRRVKASGKRVVYVPGIRVQDGKARLSGSGIFSIFTKKTTRIHLMSAIQYFCKWGLANE